MREAKLPSAGAPGVSDRLLIFVFFLAGGAAAFFLPFLNFAPLRERVVLGGMLTATLLFSVSVLGGVLLPVFALCFGACTERAAMAFSASGGSAQLRILLCSLVLTPILFLVLLHGLSISGSIQAAVRGGNPTARTDYRRELGSQLACALVGFAAIFYFY